MPSHEIKGAPPDKNDLRRRLAAQVLLDAIDSAMKQRATGTITIELHVKYGHLQRPSTNVRTFHGPE